MVIPKKQGYTVWYLVFLSLLTLMISGKLIYSCTCNAYCDLLPEMLHWFRIQWHIFWFGLLKCFVPGTRTMWTETTWHKFSLPEMIGTEACWDSVWLSITVQDEVSANTLSSDSGINRIWVRVGMVHDLSSLQTVPLTSGLDSVHCHAGPFRFFNAIRLYLSFVLYIRWPAIVSF